MRYLTKRKQVVLIAFVLGILCSLVNSCTCIDKDLLDAVENGDTTKVKILLDKGADVNAKDKKGNTPLKNALSHGKTDIAEFLREAGAKE